MQWLLHRIGYAIDGGSPSVRFKSYRASLERVGARIIGSEPAHLIGPPQTYVTALIAQVTALPLKKASYFADRSN